MTITDLLRSQEGGPSRLRSNPLKLPGLNSPTFGARLTPKRHHSKLSSASSGSNIRQKLQKGVSNIRTFFKSRVQDSDNNDKDSIAIQGLRISQDGSHASFARSASNLLKLQLTGVPMNELDSSSLRDNSTHESVPCNTPVSHRSVASLGRKISSKLLSSIHSSPTVIVKPELRSRPSVQTVCSGHPPARSTSTSTQSTPSTVQKDSSTPPTSEGTTSGSPTSVYHKDLSAPNDQLLVLFDHNNLPRKLSTIQEIDGQQIATIRTIEATAAAK